MSSRANTRGRILEPLVRDFFVPPDFFADANGEDVPDRCTVTFSGQAVRELAHGAGLLGTPLGDFVRLAVRQRAYLAEMQARGSQLVLRDKYGSEYELPAVLSI